MPDAPSEDGDSSEIVRISTRVFVYIEHFVYISLGGLLRLRLSSLWVKLASPCGRTWLTKVPPAAYF
jgi:hypothetical protein